MTPNFSLSLSFEGIVLLQRVADGWHRAGTVSLSSDDLPAEMAKLRDTASRLSGGDVKVKLIIPEDQIRYLTIETARTTLDDIHAVLEEATPLALDEMEIDFDQSGGRTHIAAVAKQTLQEAEAFAARHGFEPISFVAIAEPYTFSSEVLFGPTSFAQDTLGFEGILEREEQGPIETGVLADVAVETEAEPSDGTVTAIDVDTEIDAHIAEEAPEDITETQIDSAPEIDADGEIDVASETETPDVIDESVVKATSDDDVEIDVDAKTTVSDDITIAGAMDDAIDADDDAPMPVFASRNRTPAAAMDSPVAQFIHHSRDVPDGLHVNVDVKKVPDIAPPLVPASTAKVEPETPVVFAHAENHPKVAPVASRSVDAALARGFGHADTQERGGYWGIGLAAACIAAVALIGFWLVRDDGADIAELLEIDPGLQEDNVDVAVAPIIADPVVPAEATSETEIVEETAPIVTAVPGRVLSPADAARVYAATGVWQRAPRMPDAPIAADQSTLAGIHTFAVAAEVQDIARPGQLEEASIYHDIQMISPSNPAPANRPLQRDSDGFVLASPNGTVLPTGVLIYAGSPGPRPRLRPSDEPVVPNGLDDASVPTIPDGIVTELQYVAYTPDSGVPDLQAYAAPELTQPKTILLPEVDRQATNVALSETITTAPAPAPLEQGPVVSDTVTDAPTLPGSGSAPSFVTANVTDQVPASNTPLRSVAAIADAPLTALGAETPSPVAPVETLAAEGFVDVILGKPAIVPPLRPGTPEIVVQAPDTEVDDASAQDVADAGETNTDVFQDPALAGYRPAARPANLAPTSLVTFEAIPALANARPNARPANLVIPAALVTASPDAIAAALAEATSAAAATPAPAQPDVLDVVASIAAAAPQNLIVSPTRSAIVASPRPDTRPRNFSQLVATARSLQQRQGARDDAATTASAVAQPRTAATAPVTGGSTTVTVARAATNEDALRLRDMNLIGVYGSPGARRALVRMPNGRFVKVEVGSALDGGQVTAIGDTALNFVKRGRTYALQLPTG